MIINKRIVVNYKLKVITGLHIGGNKDSYGIGGVDSPVIKNPFNNQPIIPGSSLKGKVRMLLETLDPKILSNVGYSKEDINIVFGPKTDKEKIKDSITRVIYRDLCLSNESVKELNNKLGNGFYTEIKAENFIERVKVTATPRFIERVPAGAVFEGEYILQVQEEDKDYTNLLKLGFELLEKSALGGNGSRGYGKVAISYTE